jgi:hypothetical protein
VSATKEVLMFSIGQRVMLAGSPGTGEVLHVFGEGSIAVGWDGIGMRHHHESQLRDAEREERAQARAREEARARAEWEAGPDPYEPGPYTGDDPDPDGWCGP